MKNRSRRQLRRGGGIEGAIWAPFRSLLGAQVIGAVLGLVFWILAARLVDAHEIGRRGGGDQCPDPARSGDRARHRDRADLGSPAARTASAASAGPPGAPGRAASYRARGGMVVALGPLFAATLGRPSQPVRRRAFVVGVAAAPGPSSPTRRRWGEALVGAGPPQPAGVQPPVPDDRASPGARTPRGPRAPGVLGAPAPGVRAVRPVAAQAAATRHQRVPGPSLRDDVATFGGHALRNHALSLSLATAPQMVPVIAGLVLTSVANAEFAIAWLMATFVFLPPYLLAIALFAHGANVSTEEFRKSMEKTLPASLLLSAAPLRGRLGPRRTRPARLRRPVRHRVLEDPRPARACRSLDVLQGPPRGPLALTASLRPRHQAGVLGPDAGDRRCHDRRGARRRPGSVHRLAGGDGARGAAVDPLAARGVRRADLAEPPGPAPPHRGRPAPRRPSSAPSHWWP